MKNGFFLLALAALVLQSCLTSQLVRELNTPGKYMAGSTQKFLKVHLKDGSLFIYNDWQFDTITEAIRGSGSLYNYKRDRIVNKEKSGSISDYSAYTICRDDIALVETNRLTGHKGNIAGLTIIGVPLSVLGLYCLTNPKACFGSCPTFYTYNKGKWKLAAEGFSSSILPAFEKKDIDMLYQTTSVSTNLPVKLTNEALETHVIRYANLLAFPHREGSQIFSTQKGEFYSVNNMQPIKSLANEKEGFIEKTATPDNDEWYSLADSKNLAKKEEIILSFNNKNKDTMGLIIRTRQTLLTTYMFYQGLAFAGNFAGRFAAGIENGDKRIKNRVEKLWDKLGGIEIYLKTEKGKWEKIETIEEMGPIASDFHLVKLPENIPARATFKLKMTQGLWRIDHMALGTIGEKASPLVIQPSRISKNGTEDQEALALLSDTSQYLITYPGDSYLIDYRLPENKDYEFFLQSKGYYLEWMRDEWLAEQDLKKARLMFAFPGLFMRKTAKEYKKSEAEMEEQFWGSRYVQN